jgi:hypothetical protein
MLTSDTEPRLLDQNFHLVLPASLILELHMSATLKFDADTNTGTVQNNGILENSLCTGAPSKLQVVHSNFLCVSRQHMATTHLHTKEYYQNFFYIINQCTCDVLTSRYTILKCKECNTKQNFLRKERSGRLRRMH